ncbi:LPD29 domain-containing protein [Streptomyces nigrescens]|uniref:LPD29 domain-containing protein n=1 Tax=Streptomyces nigrescens TaxID=1920 RepID=UPI0036FE70FC
MITGCTATPYPLSAGYMTLRLPAGTRVRYAGDAVGIRTWAVQPCTCPKCMSAIVHGAPASHYELHPLDGDATPIIHVLHTAAIPLPRPNEIYDYRVWATPKATAAHLRHELRRAFPGVPFKVRRGRGVKRRQLTVRWRGGPDATEVGAVAAPLLADYTNPDRRLPRMITVTRGGIPHFETPTADAIHLNRR